MNGLRVLKFGGAALADGDGISRACELVLSHGGDRTVVVVSALAGVTDQLLSSCETARIGLAVGGDLRIRHRSVCRQLGLPSDLLDRLWRELHGLLAEIQQSQSLAGAVRDQVLSFGERASARIFAHALRSAGVLATPVDAFDLGFETLSPLGLPQPTHQANPTPGQSRLAPGVAERIQPALEEVPGVPVVTGFLAKDSFGNLTTLGRDGSDLTAAVIAKAMGANELIYWKDVPGILSADPNWVSGTVPLDQVSISEARELAFYGAQVLHAAALDCGTDAETVVLVKSFLDPIHPGTRLTASEPRAGAIALASHANLVGVYYRGESAGRIQAKLSGALVRLGRSHLLARMVAQSGTGAALWFEEGDHTEEILAELPPATQVRKDQASIAIVGENLGHYPDLFHRCLQCLAEAGIEVHQATWGDREHGQCFLVPRERLAEALQQLHDTVLGVPLALPSEA